MIAELSRRSFFERFNHLAGLAPMEYLPAWRMRIARELLVRGEPSVAEIAEQVG